MTHSVQYGLLVLVLATTVLEPSLVYNLCGQARQLMLHNIRVLHSFYFSHSIASVYESVSQDSAIEAYRAYCLSGSVDLSQGLKTKKSKNKCGMARGPNRRVIIIKFCC